MNPHKVLGVVPSATDAEIREAYQRLIGELHDRANRDMGHVDPSVLGRVAELREAYRSLRSNSKQAQSSPKPQPEGPREGVKARMPLDADDFESVAAEWLRACGVQAQRTPKGPDDGLDLRGGGYAGQCKFHPSGTVGGPEIQQLFGAAHGYGKPIFFHYGPGYTEAATRHAKRLGVSLWKLDPNAGTFRQVM